MRTLDSFNLMDPATQQCPYGFYERTRAEAPIYRMPQTGFYLITSFDLCREVMRHPDVFASGVSPMALRPEGIAPEIIDIYQNEGWMPLASCSTSDPPQHTRVRDFLEPLFTVQRVREIAPLIDRVANGLIDTFIDRGEIEFVKEFAHPMPMMIIAELIGVPIGEIGRFKQWSDAIVEPFSMMVSKQREIECARLVVEMQHYFAKLLAEREREPRDDLLTRIVRAQPAEGSFGIREQLTILTIDLLASGNETTTAAISSGLLLLIRDPAPVAELREKGHLFRNLADEILRLESPAQGMFRRVTQDTKLGGVELKQGDLLNLRFGAANRDETQFPAAGTIDLHRTQPGKHLALGIGRHHCIGAALARQEIISAFQAILSRMDGFRLAAGSSEPEYQPSFFGRNLRELRVQFSAAPPRGGGLQSTN